MVKLFNIFKSGFFAIFTCPLWIVFFVYKIIESLIVFFIYLIRATILFFQGKSIFKSREDRAIELLKEQDAEQLAERRREAMRNADM